MCPLSIKRKKAEENPVFYLLIIIQAAANCKGKFPAACARTEAVLQNYPLGPGKTNKKQEKILWKREKNLDAALFFCYNHQLRGLYP